MQRVTVTLDEELVAELDLLVASGGYRNRSEGIRDLARAGIRQALLDTGAAEHCVAALVYVFDHDVRGLAHQLASLLLDNHDISVASTRIQLNHGSGLEVAILKGRIVQVRALAEQVQALRGIRQGRLVIVPSAVEEEEHAHDQSAGHSHGHMRAR